MATIVQATGTVKFKDGFRVGALLEGLHGSAISAIYVQMMFGVVIEWPRCYTVR